MLGFSLTKVLFTALVVVGVWMLFKKFGAVKSGESRADRVRRAAESAVRGGRPKESEGATVDLIECPSCGNWIAPGTSCSCGYKHRG